MVSLFNALNISSNALTVNESAISVVSHNVANMNTEGYSKQRVNLATRNIAGAIGDSTEAQIRANGGVMIANVTRHNDAYLNNYYRDQLSLLKGYEAQLGSLGDLSDIFNDLEGEGISGALASFYEAVNNLNEYPASSTARINFIESAKSLTTNLNAKTVQLGELTTKALGDGESQEALENSQIFYEFSVFNDLLGELAEVNKALQITQTGTLHANNLLDQRDMILNDIAQYVDIDVEERRNGSVVIYSGGVELVSGAEVKGELNIQTAKSYYEAHRDIYPNEYPQDWVTNDGKQREPVVVSFVNKQTGEPIVEDANSIVTAGSIGGLLHTTDIDGEGMNAGKALDALNTIAQSIADVFNNLNTRDGAFSIDPNDTGKLIATTEDNFLFVNTEGKINDDGTVTVTAGNITINPELLTDKGCWKIACAYFEDPNPPAFDSQAVGNAQNVVAMLGTRGEKLDNLGKTSIEDYYTNLLGKIAASGSNGQALVDTQADVVDAIKDQILSNNSVDLNEELVDLVKYQTAYSAAAQVFNTCNNCLNTLMALGG